MNLLELATSIGIHGFLHCAELDRLVELAAGAHVLEIGSFRGLSAWGMAIGAKSVSCVDTFCANSAGQAQMPEHTTLADFLEATKRYTNIRMYIGESAKVNVPGEFDFIFLDAMHDYANVLADIRRWWPKVRPGGMMALHDYGHDHFPGVKQAADEVFGPAPEGTTLVTLRWVQK